MPRKPRIAIIGAGNLGTALAVSLARAGYPIAAVIARERAKPTERARKLAKEVGLRVQVGYHGLTADVFWICVPDSEIANATAVLARNYKEQGGIALHSSGALTSDELGALRAEGFAVASAHPLMTFVRNSRPSFAGVPFTIEGDPAAVRVARAMVKQLGGVAYAIRKKDKGAYHAWGTFASPLLTALLATTQRVARLAGTKNEAATQRMMPILRQTLENFAAFGPGGFSGPIVRGDVATVEEHLRVLRALPVAREVYQSLAKAALQYLPAKNKNLLRRILSSRI